MPIEQKIHLVFTTITMVVTQYGLFLMLSEVRFDKRKSRIAATVMAIVCLCICVIPCLVLERPKESNYTLLTLTLPSLIFFYIISKYRGMKFIVTYCIADVTIACVDMLGYCAAMLFFDSDLIIMMIIRCVVMIVWTICVWKFVGDRYHKALEMLEKGWGVMMLVGISMYALLGVMAGYPTAIRYRMDDVPSTMLVLILMELMVIVLIRVIYNAL